MPANRFVYDFDEPSDGGPRAARRQGHRPGRDDAARRARSGRVHDHDRRLPRLHGRPAARLPDGLDEEIDEHLAALEEKTGKRFGDPDDPLLVSVRSGAAVSMPGMMDTILNLGLNDEAVARARASATGNARFAYDSYRRLIQMYGEVVDGHRRRTASSRRSPTLKRERGATQDVDLAADDLAGLVETFKGIYEERDRRPVPAGRARAARRAVRAVFESWDTPRAQVYRARARHPRRPRHRGQRRPDGLRQQGRALRHRRLPSRATRRPASRASTASSSPNAQGEDVVAGHPHAGAARARCRSALPDGVRAAGRDDAPARGALPRHAGHRVHGRGRERSTCSRRAARSGRRRPR